MGGENAEREEEGAAERPGFARAGLGAKRFHEERSLGERTRMPGDQAYGGRASSTCDESGLRIRSKRILKDYSG
jgi:hypothetical protein